MKTTFLIQAEKCESMEKAVEKLNENAQNPSELIETSYEQDGEDWFKITIKHKYKTDLFYLGRCFELAERGLYD